jgi:3-oxoadipate enol-lactonase
MSPGRTGRWVIRTCHRTPGATTCASAQHDAWDVLPRIVAPTLVMHGDADLLNPVVNAPLLAERIPLARLHVIPGARHAYFEEFRDIATPLVRAFLDE